MTATTTNLTQLHCGMTYRATAGDRTVVGEYLGMETPYGDRAILLRSDSGTESIDLRDVTSIYLAAA